MNILMIAFEEGRWGPARLVKPLGRAGFNVAALCPPQNALAQTRYLARHFMLADVQSSRHIEARLVAAMRAWQPQLVIPADERVVACLHALVRQPPSAGDGGLDAAQRAVIVASLGRPDRLDAMLLKSSTLDLARQSGVPVPAGGPVASIDAALAAAERIGYPVYVKTSFSWAGHGVALCRDDAALAAAMAANQPRRRLPLRDRLRRLLHRDWYPTETAVDLQQAIVGSPAMYCAVAVAGKLVAGFAGITRQSGAENGPSSVVWLGAHEAMAAAAARMIEALGATGFIGFDFMIDAASDQIYLLECNPRPIQVCHLGPRIGIDLCAALARELRGEAATPAATIGAEVIALFPQEWRRDPASVAANRNHLDVPWDDPGLMRAMVAGGGTPPRRKAGKAA